MVPVGYRVLVVMLRERDLVDSFNIEGMQYLTDA
jgi:hypothetical protein